MREWFWVTLTLGSYLFGLWCQKKTKSTLCNPILIAIVLVIAALLLTKTPVADYQASAAWYRWLLTPATVCLAVPLYEQLKVLKKSLPAILAGVTAGTVSSLGVIWLLCRLFDLDRQLTVSLLPKSVTMAMGVELAKSAEGLTALATAAIFVTGILGSLLGPLLCKLLKLKDPVSQGAAFGTASHVVGTSKATELGPLQGAVGSLSLTVAGVLTALLFPLFCKLVY